MSKIKFTLDEPSHVTIKIVNVIGVEVCTLLDENEPAGHHEIDYNPDQFGPGSFYYKIYINENAAANHTTNGKNNGQFLKESQSFTSQNGSQNGSSNGTH